MENEKESIWPSTSFCGERKKEEAEFSRILSQIKTLIFPKEHFELFGKIKNIILWNHKTENSHKLMAFKDHLLWSKINSMFESFTPYTAKWLLL